MYITINWCFYVIIDVFSVIYWLYVLISVFIVKYGHLWSFMVILWVLDVKCG